MSVVVEPYQELSTENLRRVLWELQHPGLVYSREAADRKDDPPAELDKPAAEPDPAA